MNIIEKPNSENRASDIDGVVHLTGGPVFLTLCGLCDVPTEETTEKANCTTCMEVLAHCRTEHRRVRLPNA